MDRCDRIEGLSLYLRKSTSNCQNKFGADIFYSLHAFDIKEVSLRGFSGGQLRFLKRLVFFRDIKHKWGYFKVTNAIKEDKRANSWLSFLRRQSRRSPDNIFLTKSKNIDSNFRAFKFQEEKNPAISRPHWQFTAAVMSIVNDRDKFKRN